MLVRSPFVQLFLPFLTYDSLTLLLFQLSAFDSLLFDLPSVILSHGLSLAPVLFLNYD